MIVIGADPHKLSHTARRRSDALDRRARRSSETVQRADGRTCRAAGLGPRAGARAGLGDRGLPPCLGAPRALPGRPRRACRARRAEADGGCAALGARERGKSRRDRRARGRQGGAARGRSTAARQRSLTQARSRSSCCSTTARTSSPSAPDEQRRLRWHLHDLWPELEIPPGALDRKRWLERVARKLARCEQIHARAHRTRARALDPREDQRAAPQLERELARSSRDRAPQLLELPGCGTLTAAKLDRRDRRLRPLSHRRPVRPHGRRRADPGLLGAHRSPPSRPRRQPPAQLRLAPNRRHPGPRSSPGQGVPRPQTSRGQNPERRCAPSNDTSPAPSGRP